MVCGLTLAPDSGAAQPRPWASKSAKAVYGWCELPAADSQSVFYTGVFAATPGASLEAASPAFLGFLKQKYGPDQIPARLAPVCQWRPEVSPYFVGKLQESDKSAELLRNHRIVDTAWGPP